MTELTKKSVKQPLYSDRERARWRVPDLSARDREKLARVPCHFIFVAESPHVSEIAPESLAERRPLCGVAGRQWWSLLGELLDGDPRDDVSLARQLELCARHGIYVMNAVQYPLDEGITRTVPGADPIRNVGFSKNPGPHSYKKKDVAPFVDRAVADLRERLTHPAALRAPIHCLGNDAEWFVARALGKAEAADRVREKIPHPSAWWRRGGHFGRVAREKLEKIFDQ